MKSVVSYVYPLSLPGVDNSDEIPEIGIWAYFGSLTYVDKNFNLWVRQFLYIFIDFLMTNGAVENDLFLLVWKWSIEVYFIAWWILIIMIILKAFVIQEVNN